MIKYINLVFVIIFSIYFNGAVAQNTIALRYSSEISAATIKKHLLVLASDSLEGRETAQPGMEKAARYVAQQYEQMGLPAVNNNSYFQKVPLLNFSGTTAVFKSGDKNFINGTDFFIVDAPSVADIQSDEIIFAGYGIVDTVSGWNDYKNIDVNQKIVLILEGEPKDKKGNYLITKSKIPGKWSSDRSVKLALVKNKNPKAVLFIKSDYQKTYERFNKRLERGIVELDTEIKLKTIPVIYVNQNTADRLIAPTGNSTDDLIEKITKKKKPIATTVNVKTELTISSEKTSCNNVLGYIEGSDLKDELIIISAHLDHLGKRGDKIYYGADDDGSGSASLLTMAEVFSKAKREGSGPRRSVLFMSFTGEEKGLLGSEYYSDNPVYPLDKTVANLNIDMIGRVDTLERQSKNYTYIIGSDKLSTQLHAINESANRACCQLELDYKYNDPNDKERFYYRSDHYNFAKHNIPVVFYFTGTHEDYHKPTDTIDKIDFEKTAGIVKLVFNTAWELANRNERIVVDVVNDFKIK